MIIDELKPLYFFFDYSQADSLDARCAFASLIRQMLDRYKVLQKEIPREVEELLDEDCGVFRLAYILQKLVRDDVYVIDGLDQCEKDKNVLLDHLKDKKVFLSSRHELEVEKLMPIKIALEEHSADDIESFVDKSFTCTTKLQAELKHELKRGAKGMFLWADLQIKYMSSLKTDAELRESLQHLPKDLNELYTRCMSRMTDWGRKILLWTTHARRPLREDELREAIAIDLNTKWHPERVPKDIKALIDECANLVVLQDNTTSLIHHTLRQFLSGNDPLGPLCLHYIDSAELAPAKKVTLPSVRAGLFKTKPVQVSTGVFGSRTAFWSYASENWHFHFRDVDAKSTEFQIFRKFVLSPRLISVMPNYKPGKTIEQCVLDWAIDLSQPQYLTILFSPSTLRDLLKRNKAGDLPLARAVINGSDDVLVHLKPYYRPSATDSRGRMLLHIAAAQGTSRTIRAIRGTLEINVKDKNGFTPLHHACYYGNIDGVSVLLALSDTTILDKTGRCALRHAQIQRHYEVSSMITLITNLGKNETLIDAIQQNDGDAVNRCLNNGADIHFVSSDFGSLLNYAVQRETIWSFDALVNGGFNPKLAIDALKTVCESYSSIYMQRLIALGVDVNSLEDKSPLMSAAENRDPEVVTSLLKAGANINAMYKGNTALMYAIGLPYDHMSCCGVPPEGRFSTTDHMRFEDQNSVRLTVNSLLRAGADPNLGSVSPLRLSACWDLTSVLLEAGSHIIEDSRIGSPLHGAAKAGNLQAVKDLLSYGANINAECIVLGSPLSSAIIFQSPPQVKVAQYLVERGANVDIFLHGLTVLQHVQTVLISRLAQAFPLKMMETAEHHMNLLSIRDLEQLLQGILNRDPEQVDIVIGPILQSMCGDFEEFVKGWASKIPVDRNLLETYMSTLRILEAGRRP